MWLYSFRLVILHPYPERFGFFPRFYSFNYFFEVLYTEPYHMYGASSLQFSFLVLFCMSFLGVEFLF